MKKVSFSLYVATCHFVHRCEVLNFWTWNSFVRDTIIIHTFLLLYCSFYGYFLRAFEDILAYSYTRTVYWWIKIVPGIKYLIVIKWILMNLYLLTTIEKWEGKYVCCGAAVFARYFNVGRTSYLMRVIFFFRCGDILPTVSFNMRT